ncbi:MAG: hypothetical protein FWB85_11400 [Chitinispirillia bacterium]|nr:hypothetical protein [Chitinispirillia bacterium]
MKKVMFAVLAVVLFAAGAWAQEGFFASKKGMVLTTVGTDAQGQTLMYGRSTVKDVKGSGANVSVTYYTEVLGPDKKPAPMIKPAEFTVNIVNGNMEVDVSKMLSGMLPGAGWDVKISGDKMFIPMNMTAGEKFKDLNMTMAMSIDMGAMLAAMGVAGNLPEGMSQSRIQADAKIAVRDYKCLSIEKITVPAGTFEAYKTTQKIEMTMTMQGMPGMPQTPPTSVAVTSIAWNVRGVGAVKTVTYDANGAAQSTVELHELKR